MQQRHKISECITHLHGFYLCIPGTYPVWGWGLSSQLTGILVPKIRNLLSLAKVLGEPSQAADSTLLISGQVCRLPAPAGVPGALL